MILLPRLAEFYMRVNHQCFDKLIEFDCGKIETSSFLFLFSIGGDEAPSSGTTFLVSFINAGKRVCSSFENFLIFGGNVIQRYVKKTCVWKTVLFKLNMMVNLFR